MLSETQRCQLGALCEQFKATEGDVNLKHLLDALEATGIQEVDPERKRWTTYMDSLNEIWARRNIEAENVDWPCPPFSGDLSTAVAVPSQAAQNWANVFADGSKDHREQLRMERKIKHDGGGTDAGPVRGPKSAAQRKKGGKPRDEVVDDVILEFEVPKPGSSKPRILVYCLGCDREATGRDPQRIKNHAKECDELITKFPIYHARIAKALATNSHSTKLAENVPEKSNNVNVENPGNTSTSQGPTILNYMNPKKISQQQKTKIELLMFQMFICCALPWALMDSDFFANFVLALAPSFSIPDRSAFFPKHLAQEVAAWEVKLKEFLGNQSHLTLSFDGWSTRSRDEIYTFHTTTPKRRAFFTDGHIFRGISVTGEALSQIATKIITTFGIYKYSAVVGDGGPNVRAAKIKIAQTFPWLLNIYDPCHNLNLFLKDLGKLFKEMLSTVSGISNYFGKSNYGTFHLNQQRKKEGVTEGIKSSSETRFSSSYQQVLSVHACMPSILKCIEEGSLSFKTAATQKLLPFLEDGPRRDDFLTDMRAFINLLKAGANAILTLEGQNITCADVFYAWVAIAYDLEKVVGSSRVLLEHRGDIIGIYNRRFNQMMNESSHFIFLLSYFLHPLFRDHGGLQLTLSSRKKDAPFQLKSQPELFTILLKSALSIFKGEQLRLQNSAKEVVPQFIEEFIAYAYNDEPFRSHPYDRKTNPRKWWSQVSKDSKARLLSIVALKIFSICPSEICDERTASNLGWFNAARRSSMTPEHLVSSAKLYDYYVHGFNDSPSTHKARVHVSDIGKSSMPTTSGTYSAPSLMDLVNSEDVDPKSVDIAAAEELLFNDPDPYDLEETERVDPALQEPIVRNSTRYNIAKYIKLDDPGLKLLISNTDALGPGALTVQKDSTDGKTPLEGRPGEWSVESFFN